jgi:hypothetical protein
MAELSPEGAEPSIACIDVEDVSKICRRFKISWICRCNILGCWAAGLLDPSLSSPAWPLGLASQDSLLPQLGCSIKSLGEDMIECKKLLSIS